MPKDATKNIDRYKIEGGQLNEFEFQANQEDLSKQPETGDSHLIPGTPPEQSVPQVVEKAKAIVKKRARTVAADRGGKKAAAKKSAAKKASKKKPVTSKKAVKPSKASKKTPSKKAAKKTAAKAGTKKKATKKAATKKRKPATKK